jgi:hypothetical protein
MEDGNPDAWKVVRGWWELAGFLNYLDGAMK